MQNETLISVFSVLIAATGISVVFKDYLASLVGGLILRRIRQVKPGVRIKALIMPAITLKGDVISVGALRTTLHEVGDGERLPSVRTGRIVKVPNFTLVNSPLVIYDEQISDEVIAYETRPFPHLDTLEEDMRAAITKDGHEVIEVGFYQKEDRLIIHGIFTVHTHEAGDVRGRILKAFLQRRQARAAHAETPTPLRVQ
jgi:small-conductance mechanosensitive channel